MFPLPQGRLLPLEAQPTLVPRPHRGWKAGATVPPSAAGLWSAVLPAASAPLHSAAPPGEPCAERVLGPAPVVGRTGQSHWLLLLQPSLYPAALLAVSQASR